MYTINFLESGGRLERLVNGQFLLAMRGTLTYLIDVKGEDFRHNGYPTSLYASLYNFERVSIQLCCFERSKVCFLD